MIGQNGAQLLLQLNSNPESMLAALAKGAGAKAEGEADSDAGGDGSPEAVQIFASMLAMPPAGEADTTQVAPLDEEVGASAPTTAAAAIAMPKRPGLAGLMVGAEEEPARLQALDGAGKRITGPMPDEPAAIPMRMVTPPAAEGTDAPVAPGPVAQAPETPPLARPMGAEDIATPAATPPPPSRSVKSAATEALSRAVGSPKPEALASGAPPVGAAVAIERAAGEKAPADSPQAPPVFAPRRASSGPARELPAPQPIAPAPPAAAPAALPPEPGPADALLFLLEEAAPDSDAGRHGREGAVLPSLSRVAMAAPAQVAIDAGGRALAAARSAAAQIGSAVARMASDRVELRLDPPELGKVRLSFTFGHDSVSAVLAADRAETVELLRRHEITLQEELASAGFGDVDLSFGDGPFSADGQAAAEQATLEGLNMQDSDDKGKIHRAATGRLDMRI